SAKADKVVLLDEKGKEYSSVEFSKYLTKQMNASVKTLAFVVGGAFGFSEKVYSQANEKLSISKMTFSHQMIRLLFVEQLYRAFTIIKGEPYHNE
ncbi:MAG: 23S rRNA (pseudouridine(1915)-N(3))-methyltransferase RlmH, partial [Bacteroidales bacterium]|nr:23S rRNA (pseudouridine(1915)-N(3))-methyltransferase RlmH [Bacteroidales bacterium]